MNYILGDVLNAEAFVKMDDGQLVHYFSAKTMTESTINVSVSAEEIRGGWGNQLLGKIFHDTNFGVNLTEAMFSMNYLAAQIGGKVKEGTAPMLKQVKGTLAGTQVTFETEATPVAMFDKAGSFCAGANGDVIVWARDCNGKVASYTVANPTAGSNTAVAIEGQVELAVGEVCVYYAASEKAAEQLIVKAAFEPKEFSLYLYGKLFAGDSCGKSKTGRVGTITIEVPRFQLDGTVDLSFNPSSNVSVSLNGTALAYGCDCSEDGKEYAIISTVLDGKVADADVYAKYTDIIIQDAENLHVGEPIIVYLVGDGVKPMLYNGAIKVVKKGTEENGLDEKYLVKAAGELTVSVTLSATKTLTKDVTAQV